MADPDGDLRPRQGRRHSGQRRLETPPRRSVVRHHTVQAAREEGPVAPSPVADRRKGGPAVPDREDAEAPGEPQRAVQDDQGIRLPGVRRERADGIHHQTRNAEDPSRKGLRPPDPRLLRRPPQMRPAAPSRDSSQSKMYSLARLGLFACAGAAPVSAAVNTFNMTSELPSRDVWTI